MNLNEINELLSRYVAKETTAAETQLVERWLDENNSNHTEWLGKDIPSREIWLNDLQNDIAERTHGVKIQRKPLMAKIFKPAIAAAAVLAFVIGGWLVLNNNLAKNEARQELIAAPGSQKFQLLEDGTKVWLNAGSSLRYDEHFNINDRKVYLKGEAYFEVAHNRHMAFIVYTDKIATKVLGTRFNIRAYENDLVVKVALLSGKVEIIGKANDGKDKRILIPKEVAIYKKADQSFAVVKTDEINQYAHWRNEKIVFDETPLNEVVARLQQVYRVKIVLESKNLKSCKITGSFDSKNGIDGVLKSICLSIEGKYKMDKEQISIEGVGCGTSSLERKESLTKQTE